MSAVVQAEAADNSKTLRRVGRSLEAEEQRLKAAAETLAQGEAAVREAAAVTAKAEKAAAEKKADLERLHAEVWAKVSWIFACQHPVCT